MTGDSNLLSAWHSFETWLQSLKLNAHYKLILAFDEYEELHRLREHGFIVQDANGLWRLRVPLFERWLRAFDRVDWIRPARFLKPRRSRLTMLLV